MDWALIGVVMKAKSIHVLTGGKNNFLFATVFTDRGRFSVTFNSWDWIVDVIQVMQPEQIFICQSRYEE